MIHVGTFVPPPNDVFQTYGRMAGWLAGLQEKKRKSGKCLMDARTEPDRQISWLQTGGYAAPCNLVYASHLYKILNIQ